MEMADRDWELLSSLLPGNWRELAAETGALKGLRKDKSADRLLRTLLIHLGCGRSLRETVVRAREAGLADLSDMALPSGCASRRSGCAGCAWSCSGRTGRRRRTAHRRARWTAR